MLIPTEQELDEQIQLERDAIAHGLKKLHKNTRNLENKSYASASVYGAASIDTLLPLLVARIEDTNARIKEGKTGVAFKEIQQYLVDVEPLAAAAIALKVCFDRVFSHKDKSNGVVGVCEAIGLAVEQECQDGDTMRSSTGLL